MAGAKCAAISGSAIRARLETEDAAPSRPSGAGRTHEHLFPGTDGLHLLLLWPGLYRPGGGLLYPFQRGQPAASLGLAGPLRPHPRGQRVVGPGGPLLGGRGVVWGPALGHHGRVFPLPGGIRPSQPDPKAGPGTGALALGRFGPGRRPGGPRWLERLERHHPLFPGPGGQPGGRVGALRRRPERPIPGAAPGCWPAASVSSSTAWPPAWWCPRPGSGRPRR